MICSDKYFNELTLLAFFLGPTSAGFFAVLGATSSEPHYQYSLFSEFSGILKTPTVLGGGICPRGHFCPEGTGPRPLECPAGTWQPQLGSREPCLPCPSGYFCRNATSEVNSSNLCPAGYVCPEGTKQPFEVPCPAGTFLNVTYGKSVEECLPCPPGLYCLYKGSSTVSGSCSAGHFCSLGAMTPNPNNVTLFGGDVCVAGDYCPVGAPEAYACPGTFPYSAVRLL